MDTQRFEKKKKTKKPDSAPTTSAATPQHTKGSATKKKVDKRFQTALPNKDNKKLLIGKKKTKKVLK